MSFLIWQTGSYPLRHQVFFNMTWSYIIFPFFSFKNSLEKESIGFTRLTKEPAAQKGEARLSLTLPVFKLLPSFPT